MHHCGMCNLDFEKQHEYMEHKEKHHGFAGKNPIYNGPTIHDAVEHELHKHGH